MLAFPQFDVSHGHRRVSVGFGPGRHIDDHEWHDKTLDSQALERASLLEEVSTDGRTAAELPRQES